MDELIKLYYHKTDGGAEYLMDTFVEWNHDGKSGKEGVINILRSMVACQYGLN